MVLCERKILSLEILIVFANNGLVLAAEQIPKEMELSEDMIEKWENSDVREGVWLGMV